MLNVLFEPQRWQSPQLLSFIYLKNQSSFSWTFNDISSFIFEVQRWFSSQLLWWHFEVNFKDGSLLNFSADILKFSI